MQDVYYQPRGLMLTLVQVRHRDLVCSQFVRRWVGKLSVLLLSFFLSADLSVNLQTRLGRGNLRPEYSCLHLRYLDFWPDLEESPLAASFPETSVFILLSHHYNSASRRPGVEYHPGLPLHRPHTLKRTAR